jgi:AAA ATPase domain/AAA domain, putative AbiEii toxin, Type IV TA system
MHIKTIAIENYKVFLDRQEIHLAPGFNLLVGSNNSGKTTVLDVLDMNASLNDPHRSIRTVPKHGGATAPLSRFDVFIRSSYEELRQLVGWNLVPLPLSQLALRDPALAEQHIKQCAASDSPFELLFALQEGHVNARLAADDVLGGSFDTRVGTAVPAALLHYQTPTANPQVTIGGLGSTNNYAGAYLRGYQRRVYRFNAQRKPGAEVTAGGDGTLDREATSLPYCINHLQSNDSHGHRILCGLLNRIFPSVTWIEAPNSGGTFRLRCLPCDPSMRRDDLAIPIAKMGTGVGNVIAMLYVVLTAREPQVIAIDEPNAFLHPRALRELLAILESEGSQHQYVMTAHSPDVITAVNLSTMTLLDFDGTATAAKPINEVSLHDLRGHLADLGIRITDLHSRDRVLWVEGQTEELAIPDLLRFACPEIAASTAVLRVERTGTFSKRGVDPSEVAKLYTRLSTSSALVPPMVCILLDAENRSKEERARITADSKDVLKFLPRRMLESYCMDADAVAAQLKARACPEFCVRGIA